MTRSTESVLTFATKEDSQRTAPHALPINEFVSMFLAHLFSVTNLFNFTFPAYEVLWLLIIGVFLFQCLRTVLHATKEWFFAFEALEECALM